MNAHEPKWFWYAERQKLLNRKPDPPPKKTMLPQRSSYRVKATDHCPRCQRPYESGPDSPIRRSRDHILPQSLGGGNFLHGDTPNIEFMCQECNSFRNDCGHCWGFAACVDAVAANRRTPRMVVLHEWGRTKAALRVYNEGVRIGMLVHRIGVDKFIWPADTQEAREHNFRVLMENGYKP